MSAAGRARFAGADLVIALSSLVELLVALPRFAPATGLAKVFVAGAAFLAPEALAVRVGFAAGAVFAARVVLVAAAVFAARVGFAAGADFAVRVAFAGADFAAPEAFLARAVFAAGVVLVDLAPAAEVADVPLRTDFAGVELLADGFVATVPARAGVAFVDFFAVCFAVRALLTAVFFAAALVAVLAVAFRAALARSAISAPYIYAKTGA